MLHAILHLRLYYGALKGHFSHDTRPLLSASEPSALVVRALHEVDVLELGIIQVVVVYSVEPKLVDVDDLGHWAKFPPNEATLLRYGGPHRRQLVEHLVQLHRGL